MLSAFRNQKSQRSRISSNQPGSQSIGVLTPVHVEDVVRDRNLDYLQTLGQLVQKMQTSPMWYECETNQNKVKFLQIYQIAINYARNTQVIYGGILNQFQQQFQKKKQKVTKLKSDILSHKQKTLKMRKYYRKEKLNKQKQRVLHYEKNMKILRDDMLKQKRQLEQKNERLLNQERKRQEERYQQESYQHHHFSYMQNPSLGFPTPQAYPPHAYPPFYAYPPYQSPMTMPAPPTQNNFTHKIFENILQGNTTSSNETNKNIPNLKENKAAKQQPIKQKPDENLFSTKVLLNRETIEMTDSMIQYQQKNEKQKKNSKKQPAAKKQQIKISSTPSQGLKNTNKSYSFKQSSDKVRESNISSSQRNDQVKELYQGSNKKIGFQTKLSTLSMDSELDFNSIMDIQLKTQSKGDLLENNNKKSSLLLKKQPSIAEQVTPKPAIKKKVTIDPVIKQQPKSQKIQKKSSIDGEFKVKVSGVSSVNSPQPARKSLNINYLMQSNQGFGQKGQPLLKPNIMMKQKKQNDNRLKASLANSLEDIKSNVGQSRVNFEENYPSDFQPEQPKPKPQIARSKVNVALSSNSSPQTQRNNEFVALLKNYFILKSEAKGLQDSSVSGIGSLKQFSVKFVGSQRKKTMNQKSVKGMAQSDNMELIDMPQNSIIAKPSRLKQSTIRKSTIQQKIHKSQEQKTGQFQQVTPFKPVLKKGVKQTSEKKEPDANFQMIDKTLKSKVMSPKSKNLLAVPKPVQNLALQMTQSHVLNDQKFNSKESNDDDEQSLRLSVIPESQNESLFTQKSNRNKILKLIDRKYSHKGQGQIQFDKNLIKNQIALVKKNREEGLTYEQLIEIFNEMSTKKQAQVNTLKDDRKRLIKQIKQIYSNKIPSKKLIKDPSRPKNEGKSNQKQKQQDDLSYSRSMVQNIPSEKVISNKVTLPNPQSLKENKSTTKTNDNIKSSEGKQSKFIRQQKQTTDNTRLLNKIIQKSKFNQDDEIQNAVKANFQKNANNSKSKNSDDQF